MKCTLPVKAALTDIDVSVVVIEVTKAFTFAWSFDRESTEVTVITGTFEKVILVGKTYVIGPSEFWKSKNPAIMPKALSEQNS